MIATIYFVLALVSIIGAIIMHGIVSSRSTGAYQDMGLIFFYFPVLISNVVWGLSFPFFLNTLLSPELSIILRCIYLIGGTLIHLIAGVGLSFLCFISGGK